VETAERMLDVAGASPTDGIRVTGFISPIDISRSNRKDIFLFINNRPVTDAGLTTAVVQAYHTLLMVGRYPLAAVFVELPPGDVDVNVHPTKAEVRFRAPDAAFSAVQRAVRQTLMSQSPVPEVRPPDTWPQPAWTAGGGRTPEPGWAMAHPADATDPATAFPRSEPTAGGIPILRVLGQIGAAYLVAEGPDGLYLIDQHAAHERILFEALRCAGREKAASQALLSPEVVELSPAQARILEEQLPVLTRIGMEVEAFGGNAFRVRSIPQVLEKTSPRDALHAVVEDFEEDETPLAAETEARLIARICKRAAVKAGQILSAEEQTALVSALERCESPRSCPHGRPTMIHLTVALLERQFGRRG
jgi:DNA mismatch repair protein MutL